MNTIDLIIPTMWCDKNFTEYLEKYCHYESINKIFIIDNSKHNRPKSKIFDHEKINFICYGKNIYVNPAWNEGYYRSKSDVLCILNDDVFVEKDIFDMIKNLDMSNIDIIGPYLKGSIDNYNIVRHDDSNIDKVSKLDFNKKRPIGSQCYAYGVCMFIKRSSYKVIPSLYKIWFGDDYLVQNCKHIYKLKTNKIKGKLSETILKQDNLQKRINLDTKNAYKFNHFENGKNWDMIKYKLQDQKNIFGY